MQRELAAEEIIYKFEFENTKLREDSYHVPDDNEMYKKLKMALEIDKEGYNVYLIDDFSKDKLKEIIKFVKENLRFKEKLVDICYVIEDDEKCPKVLFLTAGKGKILKEMLEKMQKIYSETTYEFYTDSSNKEKEEITESIRKKRSDLINKLLKDSEEQGFTIKATQNGFTFIPMKDKEEVMDEGEYEKLENEKKEKILDKASSLKKNAQKVLEELKNIEQSGIEKIKEFIDDYYIGKTKDVKEEYFEKFTDNKDIIEFLNNICVQIEEDIKEIYSMNYEDDEDEINNAIYKYMVNVLVDNSEKNEPPVIFEEDPSVNNLLGIIEYESKNGSYITDINLMKPGSLLKANGGCIIIRANSLLNNPSAYYHLKKSIMSGKVDLDYNRGYLEFLNLTGIKPEPVKFNEKVIIIGDYNLYNLLYNYDEDFKKIFKVRAEYKSLLDINEEIKKSFLIKIYNMCRFNNFYQLSQEGITELAKFLSRKAENKNKLYIDDYELNRVLTISNNKVEEDNRDKIEQKDIIDTVYTEETVEKEINESYKDNKIFINVIGKQVGQVNGLSVIDTGYCSFGKPIRITCCCYKGEGNIIDVQKESNLSGDIHNKAISTLKGYISNLIGGYEKIPVDFHLSFEQIYGTVDGDSASVAEVVSMISALSKIGIKQNIAVTGSINQFGKVQPIGGINEKIEGFFKVCKLKDTIKDKGVLVPESNLNNIVLNKEVEEEIKNGNFHVYSMSCVKDAIEVLMGRESFGYNEIMGELSKELKKYTRRHKKSR
ncbi:ATP-dependent protease [Clostridium carboxidivorans P7]|uniref:AAA family ATPase n=1 Tax=Clostridium carboxidivorans TaxID=217159 RepID=UPI0001D3941D|nr:AAA family ATPase [Clostridium carboxidivorans]AKN33976.1 ATP-dependent protease [Clostridium carboxidivorans P7]EFG88149.1 putative ATP-dependent protease [Clostridium carboxidivorans P7]